MNKLIQRIFLIKPFSDRNPLLIGGIGLGVLVLAMLLALNYNKFTFFSGEKEYAAYFAEAGGLETNGVVEVSGARVGRVSSVALDGAKVLVKFRIPGDIRLGDRTEAAVKLKTLLGSKLVELTPRGEGRLTGPIPLERTTPAYQLPDALGDLSTTVAKLNTDQLSNALSVLAGEFRGTPPELKAAVHGVARLSQTLDERDQQLRNLLSNAQKVTKVLGDRSDEVVKLVEQTDSLLDALNAENHAVDRVFVDLAAVGRALGNVVDDNHATLRPALDKLNGVLEILDNRKGRIQEAIKGLDSFALALGEAVASGPFFKAYIVNLLPGQFVQPFIDSAFHDLGIDPATQLPSQVTDPQLGQPATPPLPLPYPRTGQGGGPRTNIPDAITGNPGDAPCSVPGRPGAPGCYPLRPEPAAPPPGGPAPGPSEQNLGPGNASEGPVQLPAPGQIPPNQGPVSAPRISTGPLPGPPPPAEGSHP
jgi:phospholipid/cholesterol/gamma-HCH transport system substrate-binding protein